MSLHLGLGIDLGIKGALASLVGGMKVARHFALHLGPFKPGQVEVARFRGRERVNEPFSYEVELVTDEPTELVQACIGGPASLVLGVEGKQPRVVQGLVASLATLGPALHERNTAWTRFRIRIVPRLWLLKHRGRNRVFQDQSVRSIVSILLDQAKVAHEWRCQQAANATWEFAYQHDEDDFAFLRRVLAHAGVSFAFQHPTGLWESLMPGASALSGAASAAAGLLGASGAVDSALGAAGMVTKVVFFERGSEALALHDGDPLTDALTDGLSGLASKAVSSAAASIGVDAGDVVSIGTKTDAFPVSDDETQPERLYGVERRRRVRPRLLRFHERLHHEERDITGVAEDDPLLGAAKLDVGISGALSLGSGGLSGALKGASSLAASLDPAALAVLPPVRDVRVAVYEDDAVPRRLDPAYPDGPARRARHRLDQLRRDADEVSGRTASRRFAPGYRVVVEGHPAAGVDGEYALLAVRSRGENPLFATGKVERIFEAEFTAVPVERAVRPARPAAVPRHGLEVASVIGPPGQDIYCDGTGRVRVRFHWAGYDTTDQQDGATCWLSVVRPWAGAGFGAQFVPRIGMEVLVGFLEGQGERPVVVGCLHTDVREPAWGLPHKATVSGIRTQSTPGGAGYNELAFDDEAGFEVARLHAARDHDVRVENDQRISVMRDRTIGVDGRQTTMVNRDDVRSVGGNVQDHIVGSFERTVGAVYSVASAEELRLTSHGDLKVGTDASRSDRVDGAYDVAVGKKMTTVSANLHETYVTSKSGEGQHVVQVDGNSLTKAREVTIQAEDRLVLRCGASEIVLTPEDIETLADHVLVAARKRLALGAEDVPTGVVGKSVSLASDKAKLTLDKEATIDAKKIKLGGQQEKSPKKDKETKLVDVKLPIELDGIDAEGVTVTTFIIGTSIDHQAELASTHKSVEKKDAVYTFPFKQVPKGTYRVEVHYGQKTKVIYPKLEVK